MSDLRDLYQETIIDHGRNPRNFCVMAEPDYQQEGFNPLCGDKIILFVQTSENIIKKITFQGCGCAISIASASLMSDALQNKTLSEFEILFNGFHQMLTQEKMNDNLGKLKVFAGVAEYPARVKCATLAWHTMKTALENKHD